MARTMRGMPGMRALARAQLGALLLLGGAVPGSVPGQNPFHRASEAMEVRYSASQPVVSYTLSVDSADTTGFAMEMRVANAADTFRVAMVRHPEYDDRFWRFMGPITVLTPGGSGSVTRLDSALWRVSAPGGSATLRWRVGVPPWSSPVRPSWRPVIRRGGALVGGPHSFLYVVGAELAPVSVTLDLPAGWDVATALTPTSDPRRYFAPTVGVLTDSPILAGRFASWWFSAGDVSHRFVYMPIPDGVPFDSAALVRAATGVAREAVAVFGRAPYREFTFLAQDGAYGGLEHASSVSLGMPSRELASDMGEAVSEMAHEYFHAWNLVRIRPAGFGEGITWEPNGETRGLWFAEGVTMLYADILPRRAGAPLVDSTRIAHVERLLGRYLSNVGNGMVSPERASLVANATRPAPLGDIDPSVHDQGEVIGTMLDLVIRDATRDRRTLDDLMRAMMVRYSADSGYTTAGVEAVAASVCGCVVRPFFDRWVRRAGTVDVDRYLRLLGLRARVTRAAALDAKGRPEPDLGLFSWQPAPSALPELIVTNPKGIWARGGLHSGDQVVAVNGAAIANPRALRAALTPLAIGDTARVAVLRAGVRVIATVPIAGYERVTVRIEPLPDATAAEKARLARWSAGR